MVEREDAVISFLRKNGPSLPVQVSKALEENVMFTSAILAGLVSTKQVHLTTKKVGNSPLYFMAEHSNHAKRMVYARLEPREKELVDFVGRKGHVREAELTPTERFFIKSLTDFFEPVQINSETYWRIPNTQIQEEQAPNNSEKQEQQIQEKKEETKPEIVEIKPEQRTEKQTRILEKKEEKEKPIKLESVNDDDFTARIKNFFIKKGIRILRSNIIRSNSEVNFVIEVQSDLIPQTYFVKARKKKKVSDKDLLNAWFESRKESMPVIFITNGELNKKGETFIKHEFGETFKFLKVSL